jgi:hypothetical protein
MFILVSFDEGSALMEPLTRSHEYSPKGIGPGGTRPSLKIKISIVIKERSMRPIRARAPSSFIRLAREK